MNINTINLLIGLVVSLLLCFTCKAEDYRLGAGDEIQILVYEERDLSMTVWLDESGVFTYPYIGNIVAAKKTILELKAEIRSGLLAGVLVNPSINVAIIKYRNIYVGGSVNNPGGFPFRPGLSVGQAITLAGGLTEWGSASKVQILREGGSKSEPVSYSQAVRPGDTITVYEGMF
ncbi:MAG: polysaccharide export protein [Pseudomonadales bacterium]|nr:polysaccharide export protein [Pseudomonadales bacterium]